MPGVKHIDLLSSDDELSLDGIAYSSMYAPHHSPRA